MLELIIWIILFGISLFSAVHALLGKRDPRAALIWIVLCLAFPGLGAIAYWLFGVNRIRTRAKDLQTLGSERHWPEPSFCPWQPPEGEKPVLARGNYKALFSLSDAVTRRPLVSGNHLQPMFNGEQAYPAMLEAIHGAEQSVFLSTYIFGSGNTGRRFVAALDQAAARGVDVRLLIDALGERYSLPIARRLFRHPGVRIVRFLPPAIFGRGINFNLRNHRKLLVVDDHLGFTGGMNIGDRHLAADVQIPTRTSDVHFRVSGPVVGQLQEAFLEDWSFATGEPYQPPDYPPAVADGSAFCRGISAGPNEEFDKLLWIIIGALNAARTRVRIMTPYFIPERPLIAALNAASLRGVKVELILPSRNNLPYVAWASRAYLWELLQYNTQVFYQPPPFAHSKLLLVDRHFALVGSANLDPRSLRLNFEFNLEVYDRALCQELHQHFDEVLTFSHRITLGEVDSRPLPVKILDASCKLFSPYL